MSLVKNKIVLLVKWRKIKNLLKKDFIGLQTFTNDKN